MKARIHEWHVTEAQGRPFTDALNALRSRVYRFQDLSVRSDEARSTAWFNTLVNSDDPWAVAPPSDRTWPGLAQLLGITEAHLRELITAEWFGVKASVIPVYDLNAGRPQADGRALTDPDLIHPGWVFAIPTQVVDATAEAPTTTPDIAPAVGAQVPDHHIRTVRETGPGSDLVKAKVDGRLVPAPQPHSAAVTKLYDVARRHPIRAPQAVPAPAREATQATGVERDPIARPEIGA